MSKNKKKLAAHLVDIFRAVIKQVPTLSYSCELKKTLEETELIEQLLQRVEPSNEMEECIFEVIGNPKVLLKAIIVPILREEKINPESILEVIIAEILREAKVNLELILEELKIYALRIRKNRRYKMANRKEAYIDFSSYDPPTNEASPLNTIIAEEEITTIKSVIQEEKEKVTCAM
ncbi:hypothetical protein [Candidatus Uabimicrobium amorphum]|uniref:Uncharacterized protein n=1 Tax=Uabimicrobium amorphum TaxID=2596890 RepID=A0A5S9IS53_UABAM|nr:hypothetical protein [Candidatus Uabimicrobium amorphum]BBM87143.1 hypothetical protein UABAM_05546 [Candidatus Uabimicrobium amorphum]